MNSRISAVIIGLAAAAAAGATLAQDGAALYSQRGCTACHGPTGNQPIAPNYPKIAGQNAAYLEQQMKDIKSGARSNGQTQLMKPIMSNVSDDEMKSISKWLAEQPAS